MTFIIPMSMIVWAEFEYFDAFTVEKYWLPYGNNGRLGLQTCVLK